MQVEVVRAWPGHHQSVVLELAEGSCVHDALRVCGLPMDGIAGWAVHGVRVQGETVLHDGDRLELLQGLLVDPKEARRKRAEVQRSRA